MKDKAEKYLIYRLKNRSIRAMIPSRMGGGELMGYVNNVERDVINNKIILTVDSIQHQFKEPRFIKKENEDTIIFTYGDVTTSQIEDDELFTKIRNGGYLDDILKKDVAEDIFCISFNILPVTQIITPVKTRRRTIKPTRRRITKKNVKKKSKRAGIRKRKGIAVRKGKRGKSNRR